MIWFAYGIAIIGVVAIIIPLIQAIIDLAKWGQIADVISGVLSLLVIIALLVFMGVIIVLNS